MLAVQARIHLQDHYDNDLKIFTDGSVFDSGDVGAGYVIPSFNIRESFSLDKGHSIFTAELIAILMALRRVIDMPVIPFSIVICADSQSALKAIESNNIKDRYDIIYEIRHIVHCLILRGTLVSFCWIPSHSGFLYNDWADQAAKHGALRHQSHSLSFPLSIQESYNIIEKIFKIKSPSNVLINKTMSLSRNITSLANRLALKSFKTQYCKDVTCICTNRLSTHHIINDCDALKQFLPQNLDSDDCQYWVKLAKSLYHSPVGRFL